MENTEKQSGGYLYLAMGNCHGHKVILGVGYTPEYADKKAKQFEAAAGGAVKYIDISVVKSGEKTKCDTIERME